MRLARAGRRLAHRHWKGLCVLAVCAAARAACRAMPLAEAEIALAASCITASIALLDCWVLEPASLARGALVAAIAAGASAFAVLVSL